MRHFRPNIYEPEREEWIAGFGDARIIKNSDGRLEIRDGTTSERQQANDWMKKFMNKTPYTLQRVG